MPIALRALLAASLLLGPLAGTAHAAFPGLVAARDGQLPRVPVTHVTVLLREPVAVVTVFAEIESAPAPLAIVLPVAADVRVADLRTVKRDLLDRLDKLTGPRFHAFYEQDPCDPSPPVQAWEHRVLPNDTGPFGVNDPSGADDRVSREIAVSLQPVFKEPVSEHALFVLDPARDDLGDWLGARGFAVDPGALAPVVARAAGGRLVVSLVEPSRVEVATSGGRERLPLAGIRYVTGTEALTLPVTLGLAQSPGVQDLFLYLLDPSRQLAIAGYEVRPAPTNLRVVPAAGERVGELYDALHDRLRAEHPTAFLLEYAWRTDGCGEPCPDAPLEPAELATLGADVVEARLVAPAERAPAPPPELAAEASARRERQRALAPAERAADEREAARLGRELARHEAWRRRHRFVLTRLHHRFEPRGLPEELRFVPAPASSAGGTGVPAGREGALSTAVTGGPEPRYQVRLVHLEPRPSLPDCQAPQRWRWGRRWDSLARVVAEVPVGRNLPHLRRDALDPARAILSPWPGAPGAAASAAAPAAVASREPGGAAPPAAGASAGAGRCGCRGAGAEPRGGLAALGVVLACVGSARRRRRGPRSLAPGEGPGS